MLNSENRRSILFLVPTLAGGGAERVMVNLLRNIDRKRFRLAVGVVDTRNMIYRDEIDSEVEFFDLDANRVMFALPKIVSLIWKHRPDVVFSTLSHLNLAIAMIHFCLPRNIRFIARESNTLSFTIQSYRWPAFWGAMYRIFYKRHDLVVCQSKDMQADLVKRFDYPQTRSIVINNPVDLNMIRALGGAPAKSLDCSSQSGIRLVAAGRMTNQKGFDLLIEAIALLADHRINLTLLGEGPLFDTLKQFSKTRGVANQIHFFGFQSNPYSWFVRSDAFVLSSRYEGFPNVILEALGCGIPVIATPATGVKEILDDIPGCIVAEEISSASLAKAISEWITGPRLRILESATEPYKLEKIIRQYEAVFCSRDLAS